MGSRGSALRDQLDWIEEAQRDRLAAGGPPRFIRTINPMASMRWIRRVTEENVDLNRNFVDFSRELPTNPAYDELADALVPAALSGPVFAAAEAKIAAFRARNGEASFHAARSAGQYSHPTGIFYGGAEPTWARRNEEAIIADYRLAGRSHVAMIASHRSRSFGYGELIMPALIPAWAGGCRAGTNA
jgi:hypothetical protein